MARLTIAAVAATAAGAGRRRKRRGRLPPHDCRNRGDCGLRGSGRWSTSRFRLTIAAVAATAATLGEGWGFCLTEARLTIAAVAATAARRGGRGALHASMPPHDCRSRGDCGPSPTPPTARPTAPASRLPQSRRLRHLHRDGGTGFPIRLTIAAVAATAA